MAINLTACVPHSHVFPCVAQAFSSLPLIGLYWPFSSFQPKTSILIQKTHSYISNLNSETSVQKHFYIVEMF